VLYSLVVAVIAAISFALFAAMKRAVVSIRSAIAVLVSKLLCCGLDNRSYICPDERASFNNVVFALDRLQKFENIAKHQVEEFELELELAALLCKLPLEGLDFVEGRLEVSRTIVGDHYIDDPLVGAGLLIDVSQQGHPTPEIASPCLSKSFNAAQVTIANSKSRNQISTPVHATTRMTPNKISAVRHGRPCANRRTKPNVGGMADLEPAS
jgi:hypothetical protein